MKQNCGDVAIIHELFELRFGKVKAIIIRLFLPATHHSIENIISGAPLVSHGARDLGMLARFGKRCAIPFHKKTYNFLFYGVRFVRRIFNSLHNSRQ